MLRQPLYRHPADDIFINVSLINKASNIADLPLQMQDRVVFQPSG